MNKPVFKFQTQFKKGKKAEEVFLKYFKLNGESLQVSGVMDYDFQTASGLRVELKTDYHDSRNFYIERSFGKSGNEKPGSFWQSCAKSVDVFIYWFPLTGEVFLFPRLKAAVKYLDSYIKTMNLTPNTVQNIGFCGIGYKIPKAALKHLYEQEELHVPLEELNNGV